MKSTVRRRLWSTVAIAACAIGSVHAVEPAASRADLAKGRQLAEAQCAACHAADGNSTLSANPKLAGQHYEYLIKQLVDYARPTDDRAARVNAIMAGFAAQLSAEDRRNVAAHFAAQPIKPGAARNRDTLELGQRIYRAGIPDKGVPACAGCHSPNGAGIPAQYPRLGGQWAEYTEAQLKAFRDGTRRNNASMSQIAARMSDAEMQAVADFIAGLR